MFAEERNIEAGLLAIWRFARGDTSASTFGQWLYAHDEMEQLLGPDLYLDAISADFGNRDMTFTLRKQFQTVAREETASNCKCVELPQLTVIGMGHHEHVFQSLVEKKKRGEAFWWLSVYGCRKCGEFWLVAQEERQNDVFCLRRLNSGEAHSVFQDDDWPDDFDTYESLLQIGSDAGHSVQFLDPENSSMVWTIEDLARSRPGIRIDEIAKLLNLDRALAETLASKLPSKYRTLIDYE